MSSATDPALQQILNDLIPREPIFHTPLTTDPDLLMAPAYREVGASGTLYTRNFILQHLAQNLPVDSIASGWQTTDHSLLSLAPDTYLLTYTLRQGKRITRRATLWHRTPVGWQILYHQGTLVSAPQPS